MRLQRKEIAMQNEIRTILCEFKDELKSDIVDEMKNVINTEFKDELKADIIGEMRTIINTEFKEELKVELKEDITEELRREIRGTEHRLGLRMDGIDDRLDGIDDRLDGVDERFNEVDKEFVGINKRLGNIENDVTSIKLTLENEIKPNICKIADGYAMLEARLDREAEEEREYRRRVDYRLAALVNQN